jgi:hypothetical protein
MQHIENNHESGIMVFHLVVVVRKLPILLVSTGGPSGQAHGVFEGEGDGGLGGDGDEKIKRASGEKHAYAVRLGLALIPLPQHGVAVADLRGAVPLGIRTLA